MSYDCMSYMCLAVLYVLSCMFSVTILCLFDRRFKSSIELVLFVLLCIVSVTILCLFDRRFKSSIELVLFVLLCMSLNKAFELWIYMIH